MPIEKQNQKRKFTFSCLLDKNQVRHKLLLSFSLSCLSCPCFPFFFSLVRCPCFAFPYLVSSCFLLSLRLCYPLSCSTGVAPLCSLLVTLSLCSLLAHTRVARSAPDCFTPSAGRCQVCHPAIATPRRIDNYRLALERPRGRLHDAVYFLAPSRHVVPHRTFCLACFLQPCPFAPSLSLTHAFV